MTTTAQFIAYDQTGYFSETVTDYIAAAEKLQPFYTHSVSLDGIKAAIEQRKLFATDRILLVDVLQQQYLHTKLTIPQQSNINLLLKHNTFTICTAHQPNLFTGHLYFVYKILHAVKLAEELAIALPENNFVPIYYMGSEDADLDELGHIFIDGEKKEWITQQTGAVGRMIVDKALVMLMEQISGELSIFPFGNEIITLIKNCYQLGDTIEQATFKLVNSLFANYGLLILLPDNAVLKNAFAPIIKKELTEGFSHLAVQTTMAQFPAEYKAQASGRALNLFYLIDDKRERIEKSGNHFIILNTSLSFTLQEILQELADHPERFSPNVILRPVLQEMLLPDIAFIGGGGEIAYWLELKKVFDTLQVPYPLLIVRNSFVFVSQEMQVITQKLQFSYTDLFKPELALINQLVKRDSAAQLHLSTEKAQLMAVYAQAAKIAGNIDVTLQTHTSALQTQAIKKLTALEKKMLSAEKKKFEAQQRQVQKLLKQIFPNNNLQERVANLLPFYAFWGPSFIQMVYDHSKGLAQEFGIILE